MEHLSKKDWAVIVLFFLLVLISSSLFTMVDETSIEATMPSHIAIAAGLGFVLLISVNVITLPIAFLVNGLSGSTAYEGYFAVLPWITATIYSLFLVLALAIYNNSKRRK